MMRTEARWAGIYSAARRVSAACLLAVLCTATAGCSHLTHEDRKAQADRHWSQVRATVKLQLARQQFDAGHVDAAVVTAREALGLDPTSAQGYLLLANALMEQGEMAEAAKALQTAEEMNIESAALCYARGMMAERTERLDEAVELYSQARRQEPAQLDYLTAEVEMLVTVGRPEEARILILENLDKFDRNGTLDVLLGEVSQVLGDPATAIAAFRRALPVAKDHPVVAESFGLLLAEQGQFAEAVPVLRQVVQSGKESRRGSCVRALAGCYLELGLFDDAGALLREWLREHTADAESWLLQGKLGMATNDLILARRCAETARKLAPSNAQVHLLHGYVCWKQKETDVAIQSLEKALALDSKDVVVHCLLGQVFADRGQAEQARNHWRQALQIDNSVDWARSGLASLGESIEG
jgi:tetratricopeptide (TPR) repeat protein